MKYSKIIEKITQQKGFTPRQADLCRILDIKTGAMSARVQRDSDFSDEEIEKLEDFYLIDLTNDTDCTEIEHIHINPSCGKGTAVLDEPEITPIKLGTQMIQSVMKISDPKNLKTFRASGDSMTPVIEDGDLLLVDTARTDFCNGGIFLLTIDNNWFIKRLRLRLSGELDIISDNEKYPIETFHNDADIEVMIKGRVIKNLSRGL